MASSLEIKAPGSQDAASNCRGQTLLKNHHATMYHGKWSDQSWGQAAGKGAAKSKPKPYTVCTCGSWAYYYRLRKQEGKCLDCGRVTLDLSKGGGKGGSGAVSKWGGGGGASLGDQIQKVMRKRGLDDELGKRLAEELSKSKPKLVPSTKFAFKEAQTENMITSGGVAGPRAVQAA